MGVAIYRPGPMQYIPGIVSVRHGGKPADNAVSRIASYNKDFSDIVTPTYLSIVYQEQVMGISVKCAGFTRGESDILRKAMGHKKADVLESMKAKFIPGAVEHGIKQEDAEGRRNTDGQQIAQQFPADFRKAFRDLQYTPTPYFLIYDNIIQKGGHI